MKIEELNKEDWTEEVKSFLEEKEVSIKDAEVLCKMFNVKPAELIVIAKIAEKVHKERKRKQN